MKKFFSTFLSLAVLTFLFMPHSFAGGTRRNFTPEEDKKLIELVNEHGELNWTLIASLMENRNPRQCRERWKHYLSVRETGKEPFSPEEDRLIFEKFNELGPKWTKISSFLPGRSDTNVKNRFMKFTRCHYNITGLRSKQLYMVCHDKKIVVPAKPEPNQECAVSEPLKSNQESDPNRFEMPPLFEDDNIFELEDDFDIDSRKFYPF